MSATRAERDRVQEQVLDLVIRETDRRISEQTSGLVRRQGRRWVQYVFMRTEYERGSRLVQAQMNDLMPEWRP